jgi:plastocyanin
MYPLYSSLALGGLALTALVGALHNDDPFVDTGRIVVVHMVYNAKGMRFVPSNIVISRGDVIQFMNVSGGPHNVAFDAATIPPKARVRLAGGMSGQVSPLTGPSIATTNSAYTMTFANVPAGKYKFFCTPHRALGMTGVITVK